MDVGNARITKLRATIELGLQRMRPADGRLLRDDRALPPGPAAPPTPPPAPSPPSPSALRRERRTLARRVDGLQRDLGGLAMEMARQNHFNYALLRGRAVEAADAERRLRELDTLIAADRDRNVYVGLPAASTPAPAPEPPPPVAEPARPVHVCARCGADSPADANFCPYCGALQTAAPGAA